MSPIVRPPLPFGRSSLPASALSARLFALTIDWSERAFRGGGSRPPPVPPAPAAPNPRRTGACLRAAPTAQALPRSWPHYTAARVPVTDERFRQAIQCGHPGDLNGHPAGAVDSRTHTTTWISISGAPESANFISSRLASSHCRGSIVPGFSDEGALPRRTHRPVRKNHSQGGPDMKRSTRCAFIIWRTRVT